MIGLHLARRFLVVSCLALAPTLRAEPYLALQQGYRCAMCHVGASGGGMRNAFGNVFATNVMPARTIPVGERPWTGAIDRLLLGGNVRGQWIGEDVPSQGTSNEFDLAEARIYVGFDVIPGRLLVYVDERLAPGSASNLEAYARYTSANGSWYARAGRIYLPFGWRLEDDTAFTRQLPGLNMTTPDDGVEVGWEVEHWTAQLAVSNGSGGGAESDTGKLATGQFAFVDPRWRVGLAASFNDSDAGDRTAYGLFGGLRTGPIAWLGEINLVQDEGFPEGRRDQLSALAEADWRFRQGHNIKLTAEWFEPDRDVDEDEQTRWSVVYEYSPLQFLQLRGGARFYDGIPQNDLQNRRLWFLELHGFF